MGFDGFDTVELLKGIENTFGISISDKNAERIHTPREFAQYLETRVKIRPFTRGDRCATAASFYQTRNILAQQFGIDKNKIRPATRMDELLSSNLMVRRQQWREITRALDVELPDFVRPVSIRKAISRLTGKIFLLCFAAFIVLLNIMLPINFSAALLASLLIALAPAYFVNFIMHLFTMALAREVPSRFATVGVISSMVKSRAVEQMLAKTSGWTRLDLRQMIQWYAAKNSGIPPAYIHDDMDFICELL